MASATPITAEVPVHKPSSPSVRLAPLLTAVITKMVTRMNSIQPPVWACLPIHLVHDA